MANWAYEQDCLIVLKSVSETLNREILEGGQLQRDNLRVWDMLHRMDNVIWQYYTDGVLVINREFGHLVTLDEIATVLEVQRILCNYGHLSTSGNILTPQKTRKEPHNYKGKAWKLVNQGREIWCRAMQIDLPNSDTSKRTLKEELFLMDSEHE